ncbi:MAG: leucine-rich repeat protein [Clostridia bacterium]|nr:leucine-rich repeat protein [Clostridia bacterium]
MKKVGKFISFSILFALLVVTATCAACDFTEKSKPDHEHAFAEEWSFDEEFHWHEAICGHDVAGEKGAHTYSDGICSVCGSTAPDDTPDDTPNDTPDESLTERQKEELEPFVYSEENGKVSILSVKVSRKNDTSLVIPSFASSIEAKALDGCANLKSLTIPFVGKTAEPEDALCSFGFIFGGNNNTVPEALKTVTVNGGSIGRSAFSGCAYIENVTVADGVSSIAEGAFNGCSSLESLTIPFVGDRSNYFNNTYRYPFGYIFGTTPYEGGTRTPQTYYGVNTGAAVEGVFYVPTSLKTVTITGGYVQKRAFENCAALERVVISDNVWELGEYSFSGCLGLKSVAIPGDVYRVGNYAFSGCISLTEVDLGTEEHSVGNNAFEGCTSLTVVKFSEKTETIANNSFAGCTSLESVELPLGLQVLGGSAFEGCTSLKTVTFDDDSPLEIIPDKTFKGCSSLTGISLPGSLTYIGISAFEGCSSLSDVTVPSGVTIVERRAFAGCASLANVTFEGDGVIERFGDEVFANCDELSFYEYDNAKYLGNEENRYSILIKAADSSIASCEINEKTKVIADCAFEGCSSLASIHIHSGLKSINATSFLLCSAIEKIYFSGTIKQWMQVSGLGSILVNKTEVYINGELLTGLTADDLEGVTAIPYDAFRNCFSVTSVEIPAGVTTIGSGAFRGCSGLKSVTIPTGVTSIGARAFSYCTSLTSFEIPVGVTTIDISTFEGCSGLKSVTVPSGVTAIKDLAFSGCASLTSVEIPVGVTSIGVSAFEGCSGLKSVTIPSGVTSIGNKAFKGCTSLGSVTIQNKVRGIGMGVFNGCTSLEIIIYEGTLAEWQRVSKSSSWNLGAPEGCVIRCNDGNASI